MGTLAGSVLVAHHRAQVGAAVVEAIAREGGDAAHIGTRSDAERELGAKAYGVLVVGLPGEDGSALFNSTRDLFPDVNIVLLAEQSIPESAQSVDAGAWDVLDINADPEEILHAATKALMGAASRLEEPPPVELRGKRNIIGESAAMQQVHDLVTRAAPGNATALIRGESGTGKELVARAMHEQSPRRGKPFVKVHCAALPDTLLESELFGYEKGAFTGAASRKPGRVELAEGGTLFLDEIGDITLAIQVKLLRLLQDKQYERLGGTETLDANVRFVAATHRDLDSMTKSGDFREDLFYRLNVVTIWLPPLRARRDDIEILAAHFCRAFAEADGRPDLHLTSDALAALRGQRWPGNVRQLQNFVEKLVVLAEGDSITAAHVKAELSERAPFATQATGAVAASTAATTTSRGPNDVLPLSEELRKAERRALRRALDVAKGNRSLAARILGVSRGTLYNKLDEHGLT